jgi:hypothetical protein
MQTVHEEKSHKPSFFTKTSSPLVLLIISTLRYIYSGKNFDYQSVIVGSFVWFVLFFIVANEEKKENKISIIAEFDDDFSRPFSFKACYIIIFFVSVIFPYIFLD